MMCSFIYLFKWLNVYFLSGLVLGFGERKLKIKKKSHAPIEHEQISIIAKRNHEIFLSFCQNSKSRFRSENSKTCQNQSCSVLPNDKLKPGKEEEGLGSKQKR